MRILIHHSRVYLTFIKRLWIRKSYESASLFSFKQYKAAEIYFDISSRFIFVGNESFARPQTPTNSIIVISFTRKKTLPLMKRVEIKKKKKEPPWIRWKEEFWRYRKNVADDKKVKKVSERSGYGSAREFAWEVVSGRNQQLQSFVAVSA